MNVTSPIKRYTEFALRHLPPGSVILSDLSSVPYFDMDVFPNQILRGTLKYTDIWEVNPDYIVLSLSLASSPMYARARQTQEFSMFDSQPYSVKLYQDIFGKIDDAQSLLRSPVDWLELIGTLKRIQDDVPTAVVYRVRGFGGPEGRPGPFSGGHVGTNISTHAFDGARTIWQSSQTGEAVTGAAFVGFDFGGHDSRALAAIRIKWRSREETPSRIILQFRDEADSWTDAEEYAPVLSTFDSLTETYPVNEVANHREWRLVAAASLAPGYRFTVEDIEFVERADTTANLGRLEPET